MSALARQTTDAILGADYEVWSLSSCISDIEARAATEEGREDLLHEAGELIEAQRRLYAVMALLKLTAAR